MYHGWVPDLHIHAEDTLLPFYLGEKDDVTYAIKPTCWPGLDIIPSCLALHRIETELMGKFDEGKLPTDPHLMLRLAIETVAHDYDVIVIDSAPNLGIGTINVVCAADVLIVPTPAELFDTPPHCSFSICFVICSRTLILKGSSLMYVFCLPNTAIVMALSPRGWRSKFGMPGEAWF